MNPTRQNLSFVYRPAKDEPAVTESDLSRQLHSSVRTPNLETSLRLLSQGADPNYYHPEKNSTPLQVRPTDIHRPPSGRFPGFVKCFLRVPQLLCSFPAAQASMGN